MRTARRLYSTAWAVTLGLVLGGAVGNLIDRSSAPRVPARGVVDFLSVFAPDGRAFPVFNLADSAIVCGGILGALLAAARHRVRRHRGPTKDRARGRRRLNRPRRRGHVTMDP